MTEIPPAPLAPTTTPTTREFLAAQVASAVPVDLLPHQRRGALLILSPTADLLDVGLAIANDVREDVEKMTVEGALFKPTLGQLAEWCSTPEIQFQFLILQPYVLAQRIEIDKGSQVHDK